VSAPLVPLLLGSTPREESVMAEIRIEKKRGVSPLLWIVLLIALIGVIWYAMQTRSAPDQTLQPQTTTASSATQT